MDKFFQCGMMRKKGGTALGLFGFLHKKSEKQEDIETPNLMQDQPKAEENTELRLQVTGIIFNKRQSSTLQIKLCDLCGKEVAERFPFYVSGEDPSMVCAECKKKELLLRNAKQEKSQEPLIEIPAKNEELIEHKQEKQKEVADDFSFQQYENIRSQGTLSSMLHMKEFKEQLTHLKNRVDNLNGIISIKDRKLKETVEQTEALSKKISDYESLLTSDHLKALDAQKLLSSAIEGKEKIEQDIGVLKAELDRLKVEAAEKKEQISLFDSQIMMESFGLYEPTYVFSSVEQYKAKLQEVREQQKQMIRDGTAAQCLIEWEVNGSRSDGKKMIKSNIRQALMVFNADCENAINNVKFSNVLGMEKRINSSFDRLNTMNMVNMVFVAEHYKELKLQELHLAYEYAEKKQTEKERMAQDREVQREAAKVAKEIEAERKRIAKEQQHYENVKQKLDEQIALEKDAERLRDLKDKRENILDNIEELDKALQDVDYREANQRAGYVYVISNIGAFGRDVYKIGMTRRLNPQDRIDELGGASVPFRFDVHAMIFSEDAPKLESALHQAFADRRVNAVNGRKEFFHVSLKEIEDVVKSNHDKTADFIETPDAQQYRETERIRSKVATSIIPTIECGECPKS